MATQNSITQKLDAVYDALLGAFGPQHWWPGETREEMIVGAVLTQNTAWANVERAMGRLKSANQLTLAALADLDESVLAEWIRPAGTYRVKARRLKALIGWILEAFGGDLDAMFHSDPGWLRTSLLAVHGVGPETADAILLYAGGMPTFVVDAYTRRVCRRHFLIGGDAGYAETKSLFERNLRPDADRYGEYHALLVELGKRHCRVKASCDTCPLRTDEHDATL